MLIVIIAVLVWCEAKGKQFIKDCDLEFYSQATWEGLLLVPALDTVFSLGWCAPFDLPGAPLDQLQAGVHNQRVGRFFM